MKKLNVIENPAVAERIKTYPKAIQTKLNALRKLIMDTAKENESIDTIEETLKWGEPSYLTKKGSTVRIDWKPKKPEQYAIYFKCTSKLVNTFKEVYGDTFQYETTRALVFGMKDKLPKKALKECIELALTYHTVKHLPRLGK